MQIIRLSPFVALQITDEIVTRDFNTNPRIYIYEYGATYGNDKAIILEDGATEERNRQFWRKEDNVILTSTPNFYLDDKIAANFHDDARIDNKLTATLSANAQFRKVRLLFGAGFAYTTDDTTSALVTLGIFAKRPSDNARIDFLSAYDDYSNSSILAINQILFDGQLWNSAIEYEIIDLEWLYAATSADVVELRTLLFGTDEIETLFVEHSGVKFSDITSFNEFGNTYTNFANTTIARQSFDSRYAEEEVTISAGFEDEMSTIRIQFQHSRFNLQQYLATKYQVSDVKYQIQANLFDNTPAFVGSQIVEIGNPLALFDPIFWRPTNIGTDIESIQFEITGIITTQENARIEKSASLVLADLSQIRSQTVNVTLEEEKLVRSTVKEIRETVFKPDTPQLIRFEKPIYVNTFQDTEAIQLVPHPFAIQLTTNTDISKSTRLKLQIGSVSIFNEPQDKLTFKIPETAFYQEANVYYILDEFNQVLFYGDVSRVSQ